VLRVVPRRRALLRCGTQEAPAALRGLVRQEAHRLGGWSTGLAAVVGDPVYAMNPAVISGARAEESVADFQVEEHPER